MNLEKDKVFKTSFVILFSLAFVIFLFRFYGTFLYSFPAHVITGGAEDSGLFAVWLVKNNYNFDHYKEFYELGFQNPELHSAFHYNWFLYYSRAFFVSSMQKLLSLNDLWLPTLIRLQTFFFSILSLLIYFLILKKISSLDKIKLFFISFFIFFGPVTGYWVISAKPDLNYIFFELLAFYFFIKNINNINYKNLFLMAIFCYFAFSTKQTSLTVFMSINLYFLINKKFKNLLYFTSIFIIAILLTNFIFNNLLFDSIFFHKASGIDFSIKHFFIVLFDFLSKSLTVSLLLAYLIFFQNKKIFDQVSKEKKIILITVIFSIFQIFPSLHIGSAVNYYYILYFFGLILLIYYFEEKKYKLSVFERRIIIYSNFIQSLLLLAIIFGIKGNLNPQRYVNVNEYKKCIAKYSLSKKVFSDNITYYRLPWITESNDKNRILVTMVYEIERKKNVAINQIKNSISKGAFKFVIIKGDQNAAKIKYDLSNYTFLGNCNSNQLVSIFKSTY